MAVEPLKSDAIVVRGGEMTLPNLRQALQTSYVQDDEYALSFFGANDMTVEEIIEAARGAYPGCLQNKKVRLSTAGRLAEAGFRIEKDGLPPHLAIKFQISPTDANLEALTGAFDSGIVNPVSEGVS
ncbi:MAG: hypothetical protein H0V60_08480 [Actinobacteria bacterium]|nr:hypothetical protein [Actinomycetota bacterium]